MLIRYLLCAKRSVLDILHIFLFDLFSSLAMLGVLVHFTERSQALEKLNDFLRIYIQVHMTLWPLVS